MPNDLFLLDVPNSPKNMVNKDLDCVAKHFFEYFD